MEATVDPAPSRAVARWRTVVPLLAVAVVLLVADQLSKLWIAGTLGRGQPTHPIELLPGWLVLQYVENTGSAFGLFKNSGWVLAALAAVVVVGLVVMAPRLQQEARTGLARGQMLVSLGLVLGGAVGNLLDRFTHGYVVDFVLVPNAQLTLGGTTYHFPNFNVADSGITVGIILLLLHLFFASNKTP